MECSKKKKFLTKIIECISYESQNEVLFYENRTHIQIEISAEENHKLYEAESSFVGSFDY